MGWLSKVFYGVDLDEEQARGNALDASLKGLNDEKLQDGIDGKPGGWTVDQYNQAEADRKAGVITDVTADVTGVFDKALADNVASVRGAVGTVVGTPFRLIPWQVWALALVALFIYMGGGVWLKGRLAK